MNNYFYSSDIKYNLYKKNFNNILKQNKEAIKIGGSNYTNEEIILFLKAKEENYDIQFINYSNLHHFINKYKLKNNNSDEVKINKNEQNKILNDIYTLPDKIYNIRYKGILSNNIPYFMIIILTQYNPFFFSNQKKYLDIKNNDFNRSLKEFFRDLYILYIAILFKYNIYKKNLNKFFIKDFIYNPQLISYYNNDKFDYIQEINLPPKLKSILNESNENYINDFRSISIFIKNSCYNNIADNINFFENLKKQIDGDIKDYFEINNN